jgi:hypothetical protein
VTKDVKRIEFDFNEEVIRVEDTETDRKVWE